MNQLGAQLSEFWNLVVDVWQTGFLGIDFGRAVTALFVLFVFLILRRLFTRFIMGTLRRFASRTKTEIDDAVIAALEPPLGFVPIIIGVFLALQYLDLEEPFLSLASSFVRSLIVALLFSALYTLVGPISHGIKKMERVLTREMSDWLIGILHIAIVLIGTAAVLEIWGIKVGPILAGLGLFGVAVALGAQDFFKNLISGILVIAEKRLSVGDWILVDGVVEGTVESIGFRSTVVRRFDKAPVHIPNTKLSDNAVTNFSEMTHRRIKWLIGIEYTSSVDQLKIIRDGIEAYLNNNSDFAPSDEVATFVRIDSLNASSIDILLYCFTRTTDWGDWLKIKEQLAYKIKEIVEKAGSGFAFPSRSVYVEKLPREAAEIFVPPGD